nr:iron ABC transporter permease [Paenibacillus gorillae]
MYMVAGLGLTVLMSAASISFGAADMRLATAWEAIFRFDPTLTEHQIIQTLRLPRTVADLIVGCSLSVCGAIMQGTTRNPLADSGLMGISSGAAFAIALCLAFLPGYSYGHMMLFACLGAALATGMTYFFASLGKRGMTPQRLILAGLSISMLFGALSQYLAINYNLGASSGILDGRQYSGGEVGRIADYLTVIRWRCTAGTGVISFRYTA